MITEYPYTIARFYDTIYHQVRDSVDSGFFLNESITAKGKVLEVGVGTGRMFTSALENGVDIHGIDISEPMLAVLRGKIPRDQHFRISRQNIVDFSLDNQFSLVIAPFRVLMHIDDKSDQLRALNNVYKHLEPGGKFIFDVFMPDFNQLINPLRNRLDFEGEYEPGKKVRRIVSTSPDIVNQVINVSFHMEWDEQGKTVEDDWSFSMRYYFRYELEHLVERSLFSSYKIYGDYKGSELSNDSKEFVIVCSKE
jgi:SAM-dependent methyltransferase